jgi:hypothetical protein
MRRIEGAVSSDGIAELEVIECDCGYHMGIDASFVTQVDDAFFDKETRCPACDRKIPVRDLLEMEPLTVTIEVSRSCVAHRSIKTHANSLEDAQDAALDVAGDYEFSEKDADYETTGSWYAED